MIKSSTTIRSVCLTACLGLSAACGGSEKKPAVAPGQDRPGAVGPGGNVAWPGGGQFAINDAPTSGEAANRPKMNAAAAQAYMAGLAAFQSGDLKGAEVQFKAATEKDKKAYQAWYSLGVVQERLNKVSAAKLSYRRSVEVVPKYEPAIAAYGVLLARNGSPAEAESYLNGKMAKMPKSAAVPAALAEVKSIQGSSSEAQSLARSALKKNPDYRPAMITIARDHYRRRRLDLALYSLKAILDGFGAENPARDKNNAEARMLRGLIHREQSNRKGAMDDFRAAVASRPDLVEARVHLAGYLLEGGNPAKAAEHLETALRYDKYHVFARLYLGDAYRLLGRASDAKKELDWVAKKKPDLAEVHYNLGLLYLFSKNIPGVTAMQAMDRAIDELEKYKKMRTRSAGEKDDTDELITRAKTKKAVMEAEAKSKKSSASKGSKS